MEMKLWQLLSAHSCAPPPPSVALKTLYTEVSGSVLHWENQCQLALTESCISSEANRKAIFYTFLCTPRAQNIELFSSKWEACWMEMIPFSTHPTFLSFLIVFNRYENSSTASWECQHFKWAVFDTTRVHGTGIRPMYVCIETNLYRNWAHCFLFVFQQGNRGI